MALDINNPPTVTERIVANKNKVIGSSAAGGLMSKIGSSNIEHEEWLYSGLYIPVDSVIYNAEMTVTAVVNTDNDRSDVQIALDSRTKQPTNAEGIVEVGMQLFSPRDKLYGSIEVADDKGTTPYLPTTQAKKDNMGNDIEWTLNSGADEVPLHGEPEWLNKAMRMQCFYSTQVAPSTRTYKWNIRKTKKPGDKSKGFKVDAGTTLVYFIRNVTGQGTEDRSLELSAQIIPRIMIKPLKNIVQNLLYNNQSEARWGANHQVELASGSGHGAERLFIRSIKSETKP